MRFNFRVVTMVRKFYGLVKNILALKLLVEPVAWH